MPGPGEEADGEAEREEGAREGLDVLETGAPGNPLLLPWLPGRESFRLMSDMDMGRGMLLPDVLALALTICASVVLDSRLLARRSSGEW